LIGLENKLMGMADADDCAEEKARILNFYAKPKNDCRSTAGVGVVLIAGGVWMHELYVVMMNGKR
jgi:hypothetical protein